VRTLPILLLFVLGIAVARHAAAETIRVATWDVGLTRDGPGLLLAELGKAPEADLAAILVVIRSVRPDLLLLTGFDHDLHGKALAAFAGRLAEGPDAIDYPHRFTAPVNAGRPSGFDLDGDGLVMGPADALGWGKFPGQGGMAVLSRLPIEAGAARSFRLLRWEAFDRATLPVRADGSAFPSAEARAAMPLSSRAPWDLPVILPGGGRLHLLASNPTPPLFDGPEGFNRLRNRDEIGFWAAYLDGEAFADDEGRVAPLAADAAVVLVGNLNTDPADGAGDRTAIAALLAHPRLSDPRPASAGAAAAASPGHSGDPALDTADWREAGGPGNLRVDYVLPSAGLAIAAAGVVWPGAGEVLAAEATAASAHRLVWVDIRLR